MAHNRMADTTRKRFSFHVKTLSSCSISHPKHIHTLVRKFVWVESCKLCVGARRRNINNFKARFYLKISFACLSCLKNTQHPSRSSGISTKLQFLRILHLETCYFIHFKPYLCLQNARPNRDAKVLRIAAEQNFPSWELRFIHILTLWKTFFLSLSSHFLMYFSFCSLPLPYSIKIVLVREFSLVS